MTPGATIAIYARAFYQTARFTSAAVTFAVWLALLWERP